MGVHLEHAGGACTRAMLEIVQMETVHRQPVTVDQLVELRPHLR